MKCPKCGYLGFERVDRCRNCGYNFSLAPSGAVPDLALRSDRQAASLLEDLALAGAAAPAPSAAAAAPELPLFGSADEGPLITRPSPPRPPLAVRRATPEVPRLRGAHRRAQTLELDLEPPVPSSGEQPRPQATTWPTKADESERLARDAGLGARLLAVLVDFAILAAVDAAVVYFTMQICGITVWELGILPKGPLIAFLLVQNGGYLVAFTAGGQTLGKMAAGIKVVSEGSGSPVSLGRALLRTLVWVVLVVPAGLGFLTALFGGNHRGLHDRFARTRVVRASA